METLSSTRCFGGEIRRVQHRSSTLDCDMVFGVFLPPQAQLGDVPSLLWLSGLTCNDENFMIKSGAQRYATELGMAIICPDTSPRGTDGSAALSHPRMVYLSTRGLHPADAAARLESGEHV